MTKHVPYSERLSSVKLLEVRLRAGQLPNHIQFLNCKVDSRLIIG